MKMNIIALALGMGMAAFSGASVAADVTPTTDSTHVHFIGSITNAPCSMTKDSLEQKVPMGSIAAHVLVNGGTSDAVPFHFDLTDCPVGSSVAVTFGGASDSADVKLLALGSGKASGAGIQILADGKPVTLGMATTQQNLSEGDNTLTFSAQLKGDNATVNPGDFDAVSDVTFTYQ